MMKQLSGEVRCRKPSNAALEDRYARFVLVGACLCAFVAMGVYYALNTRTDFSMGCEYVLTQSTVCDDLLSRGDDRQVRR